MTEQQSNIQTPAGNDELAGTINLHDIIRMVVVNWYWFVLSVLVCIGAAYYYLAKTPKIYNRTATILVKDTRKGGDIDLSAFSDLAGFQTQRSVDNEIFVLQPHRQLLHRRTTPRQGPLRTGPHRRHVHQRQRQPVALDDDHPLRRGADPTHRIPR